MEPNIWGPHAWLFLHTITLNYPDHPTNKEKEIYRSFFKTLGGVLPCEKCREHYLINLEKYPIQLESKEDLTKWLFNLHNQVNIKNNKSQMDYDEFIHKYSRLYDTEDHKILYFILMIVLIIIAVIYYYKR